jgi:choline dehydrogenase-like flavoprotein
MQGGTFSKQQLRYNSRCNASTLCSFADVRRCRRVPPCHPLVLTRPGNLTCYGSNPIDLLVLRAAIDFNSRLIATESMALLLLEYGSPPANSTPEDIMLYIRSKGQTEYHPSGSAAMMPWEMGGIVDPELLVYGTGNLRVVDASVMPLVPTGHLQAVVYAVAEKVSRHVFLFFIFPSPF